MENGKTACTKPRLYYAMLLIMFVAFVAVIGITL
jgi:hypothetical protein